MNGKNNGYIYTEKDVRSLFNLSKRCIQQGLYEKKYSHSIRAEHEHGRKRYLREKDVMEYVLNRVIHKSGIKEDVLHSLLDGDNISNIIPKAKGLNKVWISRMNVESFLEKVGYDSELPEGIDIVNKTNMYWSVFGRKGTIKYVLFEHMGKIILSLDIDELTLDQSELFDMILKITEKHELKDEIFDFVDDKDNIEFEINYEKAEIRIGEIRDFSSIIESLKIEENHIASNEISFNELMYEDFLLTKDICYGYKIIGGIYSSEEESYLGDIKNSMFINPIISLKVNPKKGGIYKGNDLTMVFEESENGTPQVVFYDNNLRR